MKKSSSSGGDGFHEVKIDVSPKSAIAVINFVLKVNIFNSQFENVSSLCRICWLFNVYESCLAKYIYFFFAGRRNWSLVSAQRERFQGASCRLPST